MTDPVRVLPEEYLELGLSLPGCQQWLPRKNRYCGQPQVDRSPLCRYHGGLDLVAVEDVAGLRKQMTEAILPVAIARLLDIVDNPDSVDADVIRAAFGIMDRVGLGPVQGLVIDGNVNVQAPLDALQGMLSQVAARMVPTPEIVDAEIVE